MNNNHNNKHSSFVEQPTIKTLLFVEQPTTKTWYFYGTAHDWNKNYFNMN